MGLTVICGAECGIVSPGIAGTLANQHWASNTAATIDTGTVRSGGKSIKVTPAGNAFSSVKRTPPAGVTVLYVRLYFQISTATPGTTTQIITASVAAGSAHGLLVTTAGVLRAFGHNPISGPTIVANTWYGVEMEFDCSANPNTARWRVWTAAAGWVDQPAPTPGAQAATTFNGVFLGAWGPTTGVTVYLDDILIGEGTTLGEDFDPAVSKGGSVSIYRPNADGTHSFTAGDFGYDAAGADVGVGDTTVYQKLDESDQQDVTDFIRQKVIRTTGYVEVAFADEADTTLVPRAVAVTSTHHASSTGANQQTVKVSDDGGSSLTTVWNNDDVSDTTAHYRHKPLLTKPSGGSWTRAALNALVARLGYSGDVTDIPYWDSISLEVEYTEAAAAAGGQDPFGAAGFFGT